MSDYSNSISKAVYWWWDAVIPFVIIVLPRMDVNSWNVGDQVVKYCNVIVIGEYTVSWYQLYLYHHDHHHHLWVFALSAKSLQVLLSLVISFRVLTFSVFRSSVIAIAVTDAVCNCSNCRWFVCVRACMRAFADCEDSSIEERWRCHWYQLTWRCINCVSASENVRGCWKSASRQCATCQ